MPKIVQYNLPPGGTVVQVADNTSEALDISSTDAKDYITIDTTDGSEKLVFNSGQPGIAAQVGVSNRGPRISGTTGTTYPAYNFIGDEDTGMTHLGTSNNDTLALVAGGVEGIRLTEDTTILAEIKGKTIITDPSGPSGNAGQVGTNADTLVIDTATDGGLTIVGETGDPMRLFFVADDYDYRSGILAKAKGSGGASATRYLDFLAGGSSRMIINQDDITLKERTVITADTSGTPDDLGDYDNYALVLQGSSSSNDETALLLSSSSDTYGGSAIVHKDTDAGGKGELNFYTKQSTAAEPPVKVMTLSDSGVCILQAQSAIHYNAGTGSDTATTEPVYLADTNATMIVDFSNGNVGDITLAANVTAVKFLNAPADGTVATITAKITQDSSVRTFDYGDSAVTVYSDGGSTAVTGEIKFAGGTHHVQSTGSGAVDLVSFTCIPSGSAFNVYAKVIGQAFA